MPEPKNTTSKRKSHIAKGKIVSLKMEDSVHASAQKSAFAKHMPFSMWMREAAREKLSREIAKA